MRRIRNATIATKLSVLTLFAISASLSLCFAAYVYSDLHTLKEAKRRQIEALAMVLGENSISAIEFNDSESAAQTLSSLAKQPNVESAILYDRGGSVFATFPETLQVGRSAAPSRSVLEVVHKIRISGDSNLPLPNMEALFEQEPGTASIGLQGGLAPDLRVGDVIGTIVIRTNTADIAKQIYSRTFDTAVVLLASLLMGVAISWYFRRWITVPVNDLVLAARHVTKQKDYAYRVHKHGEDELGVLADAFNAMLTELKTNRDRLQRANDALERRVDARTAELARANTELQREMEEREALQEDFMTASRQAGMAEVATGVLHNVGNVLNSVNVTANLLMEQSQDSRVALLEKVVNQLGRQADLVAFVGTEQGRHLPRLLKEISLHLSAERDSRLSELRSLNENIGHVKEIISMQQTYACVRGTTEMLQVVELIEDALRMNDLELVRHGIEVVRDYENTRPILTEKHKVLQILVNLISNAKHALMQSQEHKEMLLRVGVNQGKVVLQVRDNGVGIPPENLTRVFSHGFTTKKQGHGFGLHSSALAAQELGGSLSVHSDGEGQGATFTLHLPMETEVAHEA